MSRRHWPRRGATRFQNADLVVATTWPESDRKDLETRLELGRVSWVEPTGAPDPTRLISRGFPAHFVLGGPASSYERLTREGWLAAPWITSRVEPLGLALRDSPESRISEIDLTDAAWAGRWQLPDPRRDPVSLAWCRSILTEDAWSTGYARLVRSVALSARADTAVDRPWIRVFPTVASQVRQNPSLRFLPESRPGSLWVEGMAVSRGVKPVGAVDRLLQELSFRHSLIELPAVVPPLESDLLADLLGAVLVEARPELSAAAKGDRDPQRPSRGAKGCSLDGRAAALAAGLGPSAGGQA